MGKEKVQEEISGGLSIDPARHKFGTSPSVPLHITGLPKNTKGKAKLTLVPRKIFYAIAAVREYGNRKYQAENKPDNWKQNPKKDFQDAALRHLLEYLDDNNSIDVESGLPHLHHLACNIAFLIEGGFAEDQDKIKVSDTVFTEYLKITPDGDAYLHLYNPDRQIKILQKELVAELLFAYCKFVQLPHDPLRVAEELERVYTEYMVRGNKDE